MDVFNFSYIVDCVEKETLLPNLLEYRCIIGVYIQMGQWLIMPLMGTQLFLVQAEAA
jgi:hypothetical protein